MADTSRCLLRLPTDAMNAATERAAAIGISRNEWLMRAVAHALEHAKASGEPPPLALPWSLLL